MFGTADSVLIREVSFIQSALYREVPLYSRLVRGATETRDHKMTVHMYACMNCIYGECYNTSLLRPKHTLIRDVDVSSVVLFHLSTSLT